MLTIVHGLIKYFNFDPAEDLDYEYTNHYDSLRRIPGVKVIPFFYDCVKEIGPAKMNERLFALIQKEKPDMFYTTMPNELLDKAMLLKIKEMTLSLGWYGDDDWHFDNCGKYWAPYLTWASTTYSKAIPKYHRIGYMNVMHTELGANHWIFTPPAHPEDRSRFKYDVTLMGTYHPKRGKMVDAIRKAGATVGVWGTGWPDGRLPADQMNSLVHQTRINIDISPGSSYIGVKPFVRFFFKRDKGKIKPDFLNVASNIREWWQKNTPHVRPRTFNASVAGGFVISQMAIDLEKYYEIGKEIVSFKTTPELVRKVQYYLEHEDEREAIARAGYLRTIRDHTWEKRFMGIFRTVGLAKKVVS